MSPEKQAVAPPSSKSKKNKKKNSAAKQNADGKGGVNESIQVTGNKPGQESKPQTEDSNGISTNEPDSETPDIKSNEKEDEEENGEEETTTTSKGRGTAEQADAMAASAESENKFDALVRDRDSLRAEVTELRKSLEELQNKHTGEMEALQQRVTDSETKKEQAESQFQKLMERVNTIKSQLGERLKEDAEELSRARTRIEALEEENSELKEEIDSKTTTISGLRKDAEENSKELIGLRDRAAVSQQNWIREKEELLGQESDIRIEFEEAKQAMHNWEVLAMEERSIREGLVGKVNDLEEQLSTLRDEYNTAINDNNTQSVTIDGLQRALQEIQDARKQELRELVQSSDAQLEELRTSVGAAEERAIKADTELEQARTELSRLLPFEKDVKEKNLLIGKLRHEAVTLNDHLTKALRFLKKGKPEDNVDRHIVTNHLLHFLALDRSDPKKFQILQLIAALLQWNDDQREQAGLARPGTSGSVAGLQVPKFSVSRRPSAPSLATEYMENGHAGKETLAELWSNFLEQEAQTGGGNATRSGSNAGLKSP
ncbi:putative Golgi matrix protein [Talaromyces proteolyticus]|uniref:Golgi matrix protein n=1 Tax=Talaromyces proteolyticus TaxID=1131652 RepID=A0AAD4PXF7_9EURO|nr:putative Golgi matrix protein [Talaromyces proteolyticus]KAH8693091.1 putative Golgi matrix protein [Talaromyces proteolyticus]